MRDIKFRGKSGGVWVFGDLSHDRVPLDENYYFYDDVTLVGHDIVNPDSVGQATGMLDKTGREVYEGDVVEDTHLQYEICWYDAICAFIAEAIGTEKPFLMSDLQAPNVRIIGNIHDNPELIK